MNSMEDLDDDEVKATQRYYWIRRELKIAEQNKMKEEVKDDGDK